MISAIKDLPLTPTFFLEQPLGVAQFIVKTAWAATLATVPSHMCDEWRLKSACASVQSDQSSSKDTDQTVQMFRLSEEMFSHLQAHI